MWDSESTWQFQEDRQDGDLTGRVLDELAAKNDSFPNIPTLYSDTQVKHICTVTSGLYRLILCFNVVFTSNRDRLVITPHVSCDQIF